jgi:hypothetical protein
MSPRELGHKLLIGWLTNAFSQDGFIVEDVDSYQRADGMVYYEVQLTVHPTDDDTYKLHMRWEITPVAPAPEPTQDGPEDDGTVTVAGMEPLYGD